jgi:hypothetical protein
MPAMIIFEFDEFYLAISDFASEAFKSFHTSTGFQLTLKIDQGMMLHTQYRVYRGILQPYQKYERSQNVAGNEPSPLFYPTVNDKEKRVSIY